MPRRQTDLSLPAQAVHLRSNGIEFLSTEEIPVYKELLVDIHCPDRKGTVQCQGMVARCVGNRHNGYVVCIYFTSMAPEMMSRIQDLLQDQPATL